MPSPKPPPGRRERKKAATRLALSNTAVEMFVARGFDNVTVREIADAVDVSTTTLMKYFPTKEALIFDRDDEIERGLVAAVAERPAGTSVLDALRAFLGTVATRVVPARVRVFMKLVRSTPALTAYWQNMWLRHAHVLARALAKDLGRPAGDLACATLSHFVLEAAALSLRSTQPVRAIDVAFDLLEHGWPATSRGSR